MITTGLGIKTSCRHKRELQFTCRNSNNGKLKRHYQVYRKVLSNVIKESKRIYYDKKIQKSNNKCKTTWDIITKQTNNHHSHTDILVQELMIVSKLLHDQQDIADAFNSHFLSIIANIRNNNVNNQNNSAD